MNGATYWANTPKAACAFTLNGAYIETSVTAYRTLTVMGRHSMEADITAYDKATEAGAIFKRRREVSRTIEVGFAIKTDTTANLHEAIDKVNGILRTEQAKLIFDDEPAWYYIGTRAKMEITTLLPTFASGTIEIFCADPYKYGNVVKSVDAVAGVASVTYNGTVPAAPVLVVDNTGTGEIGGFTAELGGAQITVGDLVTPDGTPIDKPEQLDEVYFTDATPDLTNWADAAAIYGISNFTLGGTVSATEDIGLRAMDYGTADGWHGPGYVLTLPPDSNNVTGAEEFSFTVDFRAFGPLATAGELVVSVLYYDTDTADYKAAATINVRKAAGANYYRTFYIVDGMYLGYTDYDGTDTDGYVSIRYSGVMFNLVGFGGGSKYYRFTPAKTILKAQVVFGANGTAMPTAFRVRRASFIKADVQGWNDFPNLFPDGTNIQVDAADGAITVNGETRTDLGNLDNDFENFRLQPGANTVNFSTNDWVVTAPTYTVNYREVRL